MGRNDYDETEDLRQQRWQEDTGSRDDLYAEIGELWDDAKDDLDDAEFEATGKTEADRNAERYPKDTIEGDLHDAYQMTQAGQYEAGNDAHRFKAIKKLDKDLRTTHHITGGVEQAIEQAMKIDKGLRENPAETLQYLQQRYFGEAQQKVHREVALQRTTEGVNRFMESKRTGNAKLDDQIASRMNEIASSDAFKHLKTGHFHNDIRELHRSARNTGFRHERATHACRGLDVARSG